MRTARGVLAVGLAAAGVHWSLAAAGLVFGVPEISIWFGLVGVLTAVLALLAFRAVARDGGDADGGTGRPDDDGGGGGGGGPPGGGQPPGGEPPWWPEFERAFRAHAARREREPV